MKRKKKYTKNKPPKHIIEQYTDGLRQKVLDGQTCALIPDDMFEPSPELAAVPEGDADDNGGAF